MLISFYKYRAPRLRLVGSCLNLANSLRNRKWDSLYLQFLCTGTLPLAGKACKYNTNRHKPAATGRACRRTSMPLRPFNKHCTTRRTPSIAVFWGRVCDYLSTRVVMQEDTLGMSPSNKSLRMLCVAVWRCVLIWQLRGSILEPSSSTSDASLCLPMPAHILNTLVSG